VLREVLREAAELSSFIRFQVALASASLSVAGAIVSGCTSPLPLIAFSSFCTCAAGYAYNRITDVDEDRQNGAVNKFAVGSTGMHTILLLLLAGFAAALLLPERFVLAYVVLSVLGMAYSYLRVKALPLVKNIYTSVLLASMFLFGTGFIFSPELLVMSAIAFFVVFSATVIADMRDIEGDRKAGVVTVANSIGFENARLTVLGLLAIAFCLSFSAFPFAVQVIPSSFLALGFLFTGRVKLSHFSVLASLFLFAFFAGA